MIAVIGDDETVTGLLLAGIGNRDEAKVAAKGATEDAGDGLNFFVVDPGKTTTKEIEDAFFRFTKSAYAQRKVGGVSILLINQYIAHMIRDTIDAFEAKTPAILEIPSKEHPYDPEADAIHRRTKLLLGIRD